MLYFLMIKIETIKKEQPRNRNMIDGWCVRVDVDLTHTQWGAAG